MKMRLSLCVVAALSAAAFALPDFVPPAQAQWFSSRPEGPFCLESYGRAGSGRNCDFYTYEQCQTSARGIIGTCAANPWYVYDAPPERVRRRRY